ncbi:MAG: helix-turn-helix domain-containing protein [Acidobacteriota bacterium]|nr:helix-turn-helix domain-containing protein [Acidobacteriota bacterium]
MNEVQSLVDGLAERLQRPVGVDDRKFRAIAYSSHPSNIDTVRRDSILGRKAPGAVTEWLEALGVLSAESFVRIPENEELDMVARVCFPLRFHGRLLGFLWLVEGDDRFDDAALADSDRVAAELSEELYRLQQVERDERDREADQVRSLLSGGGRDRPQVGGLATGGVYGVMVVGLRLPANAPRPPGLEVRLMEAVDRARRSLPPRHQLASVTADQAVVLAAVGTASELQAHAELLLAAAARELADLEATEPIVGLSEAVATQAELGQAHERAELALRLATVVPTLAPLVGWDQLGPLGLVGDLLGDRDPTALIPTPIRRLTEAADGETLLTTLEAYLEHAGDVADTAAELFLHRSSLYKRLHRIERLAEVDLRSGRDRLQLHLGVILWRLAGHVK